MYDGLGRVVGHSSNGFATSYAYTPMGTLGTRSVTSGTISVSGSYSYEETDEADEEIHPLTGRISGYTSTVKNGSTVKSSTDYTYTYDGAGNITEIRIGGVLKYRYTYDNLGQLTREDNAEAGKSYVYTYDDGGNILSKRTYSYTTGNLGTVQRFRVGRSADLLSGEQHQLRRGGKSAELLQRVEL